MRKAFVLPHWSMNGVLEEDKPNLIRLLWPLNEILHAETEAWKEYMPSVEH